MNQSTTPTPAFLPEQQAEQTLGMAAAVRQAAGKNFDMAQGMGMFGAFDAMNAFTGWMRTQWLMQRQQNADYKGAQVMVQGQPFVLNTFDDLCNAVGISSNKAYKDIQNLREFGLEFIQRAEQLNLGYRDLRKINMLPEQEKQALLTDVEKLPQTKEGMREYVEDLLMQNAKTGKALSEARQDLQAREARLAKVTQERDTLQEEKDARRNLPEEVQNEENAARREEGLERMQSACLKLTASCGHALAIMKSVVDEAAISGQPLAARRAYALLAEACADMAAQIEAEGYDLDLRRILGAEMAQEMDTAAQAMPVQEDGSYIMDAIATR